MVKLMTASYAAWAADGGVDVELSRGHAALNHQPLHVGHRGRTVGGRRRKRRAEDLHEMEEGGGGDGEMVWMVRWYGVTRQRQAGKAWGNGGQRLGDGHVVRNEKSPLCG